MKTIITTFRKCHLLNLLVTSISFAYYLYFKIRNNIKIVNAKYLPPKNRPRFILAGNHGSAMDAYLIFAVLTARFGRRVYAVVHERSWRKDNMERLMLETFDMIKREGTGNEVIEQMARYLLNNKTIVIPPEGMTSTKVMKGYTGIIRLYWRVNHQIKDPKLHIPIIPIVSIGATIAYPISLGEDGKYHPQKTGIIGRFGKPITFSLPEHPTRAWYREKTDVVMEIIAQLALQKEGPIESWKLNSLSAGKKREYKI